MPDLKLTLACWDYDRTRPLIDGRVKAEGIGLDIEVLRPRQAFQRMLDNKGIRRLRSRTARPSRRSAATSTSRGSRRGW
jgi:hypothetical protein